MKLEKSLAICSPKRLPFAQIGKALAQYSAPHLGLKVAKSVVETSKLSLDNFDGVVVGEGFPNAPNSARIIANLLGLDHGTTAITVNNNCVSGMEGIAEAARRISMNEGDVFLVIGEESQTSMPFIVQGARQNKKTATLTKLKPLLPNDLPEGVEIRDTLEDGLGDGETSFGMQVTAEILAQNYSIKKETTDNFAHQSFTRAYEAFAQGLYDDHMIPIDNGSGGELKADEAVLLRKGLVENPTRMGRAMMLFENPYLKFDDFKEKYQKYLKKTHGPTITIFSASPRSDGAAGLILTTEEKAKSLGLKVEALVTGWRNKGVDPNLMGIGQAVATLTLLDDMNMKPDDLDYIEIHEAFAATAVATLEEIQIKSGYDWQKKFEDKKINPYGGSIAIGHPFGATGVRLAMNAIMDFHQDENANKVLITACAHGGVAGAMMIERPAA